MPLAQDEEILSTPGGIDDVEINEATVIERDEGYRRRECAAGMQALVHRVAALFEAEEANVRIFDGEELEETLAEQVVARRARVVQRTTAVQRGSLRRHYP